MPAQPTSQNGTKNIKIAIIGAGYAGLMAALRLSRHVEKAKMQDVEIVLFSNRTYLRERIRLHERDMHQKTIDHDIQETFLARSRYTRCIRLCIATVTHFDPQQNQITYQIHQQKSQQHSQYEQQTLQFRFDYAILAVGSVCKYELDEPYHHHNHHLEHSKQNPKPILQVIGAGLTGVEYAAEAAEQGRDVSLICQSIQDLPAARNLSASAAQYLYQYLKGLGVKIRDTQQDSAQNMHTNIHTNIQTVWTHGFQMPTFLQTYTSRIPVDGFLRMLHAPHAPHQNIFCVGDCADVMQKNIPMGCKSAMPMGAYAADQIFGLLQNRHPQHTFSWFDAATCISLGRHAGLVQFYRRDGSPSWHLTGRFAAWIKELICRYTLWALLLEKRGFTYVWPHAPPSSPK